MQSIFLVKTPMQLLNATEARAHFGVDEADSTLVIMGDRKSRGQILSVLQDTGGWGKVLNLAAINPLFGDPLDGRAADDLASYGSKYYIQQLNRLARRLGALQYVFIGQADYEYMKHFMNVSRHEQAVFLDDGHATHEFARQIRAGGLTLEARSRKKRMKLALRRKLLGLRDEDPERFCFFTAYDVELRPGDEIVRNRYPVLRARMGNQAMTAQVYFIGSALEDEIVGFDTYIAHLVAARDHLGDKQVLYVAHRREGDDRLQAITARTGLPVTRFEYPIEYQLVSGMERPAMLASFMSSALDSCHLIFGELLPVVAFRLPVKPPFEDEIGRIYEGYEAYDQDQFRIVALQVPST